jgi:hypothetical protein
VVDSVVDSVVGCTPVEATKLTQLTVRTGSNTQTPAPEDAGVLDRGELRTQS